MSSAPLRPCRRCKKIVDELTESIERERKEYELTKKAYEAQVRNFRLTIANTVTYLRALGEPDANPVMETLLESMGSVETIKENCDECDGLGSFDIERGGSWISCESCGGTGVKDDDDEEEITLDEEIDDES